jgi:hypothetical protein
MTLSKRKLYFLYRCFLAGKFASPSRRQASEAGKPMKPSEVEALVRVGLVFNHGGEWRCSEAGMAELAIAGIDTRSVGTAEHTWNKRWASTE